MKVDVLIEKKTFHKDIISLGIDLCIVAYYSSTNIEYNIRKREKDSISIKIIPRNKKKCMRLFIS
jgi:hypothetical protein